MSLSPVLTLRDVLNGDPFSLALQVIDDGKVILSLDRQSMRLCVEQVACKLQENGVREGDVVSFAMGNTAEYVITFIAATWLRAIAAPFNPGYKVSEFEFYMEDVKAKILVVGTQGNSEAVKAAKQLNIPVFTVTDFSHERGVGGINLVMSQTPKDYVHVEPSSGTYYFPTPMATDIALYLHTSGTTGKPKLVPLSHHNLCTSMSNIRNTFELSRDISYVVMPLFHIHGLQGALFAPLCAVGCIVLPKGGKFSASVFWNDILGCNATYYTAVPTIHQILLARADTDANKIKQAKLRFIRSCSSPLAPAILHQMEDKFGAPVCESYAMSEAAHQMTSNPLPKNGPRKPGTVGRGTNVQVAILDDEDNVIEEPGKIGNVCIRGENVTSGYYNRPEANKSDFANGWFHTGDLGSLDSDGYLTLTGRKKEIINRGGEKIAPNEIDSLLLSHPDIKEAVAFGSPHAKYGEEVCVAVVPKPGKSLTAEQVTAFCAEKLSKEKVPTRVIITDAVPKTATGKIQRRKVAAAFNTSASKL